MRCLLILLLAASLLMPVFPVRAAAGSTTASVPSRSSVSASQEDLLRADIATRTHMVTVPAVLTLDVVSSGGSGLYSYQWSLQYEGEQETGISTEEEFDPHREISVYKTGKLMIRVTVTDRRTGYVTTAVTDTIQAIDRTQWRWDPSMAQADADTYYSVLMACLRSGEDPLSTGSWRMPGPTVSKPSPG